MEKRLIRERALREAVDIFKKNNSDVEEVSQDELVCSVQVTQRSTGLDSYVFPQLKHSTEQKMQRKELDNVRSKGIQP